MRAAARIAVVVGALGTVTLMLYAGRSNRHYLVTVLFIIWVLAPFVTLALARRMSEAWSSATRTTLQVVTIIVAVASLAVYGYRAMFPPRSTGAFVFVIVPLSLLLVLLVLAIAALLSRRLSRKESV